MIAPRALSQPIIKEDNSTSYYAWHTTIIILINNYLMQTRGKLNGLDATCWTRNMLNLLIMWQRSGTAGTVASQLQESPVQFWIKVHVEFLSVSMWLPLKHYSFLLLPQKKNNSELGVLWWTVVLSRSFFHHNND